MTEQEKQEFKKEVLSEIIRSKELDQKIKKTFLDQVKDFLEVLKLPFLPLFAT